MPKAVSVNEVVSMDLKERRDFKKEILYICDEFSGYIVAEVIKDKRPETVINAFNKRWVREGPGIPLKGIFVDNGGEFKNSAMIELASKYGIDLKFTAANSPWSNGKNERNHYSCDIVIDKLLEEDDKMTLEEAVSHAVNAKNMQITRRGFSPRQLMFGHQGVIPGISEGNPINFEPIVESDIFKKEFINRQRSEALFRQVDASERIKKALTQNVHGYVNYQYKEGEKVLFKEDGKNRWSGPAVVLGVEGSKIRVMYSGYPRTVPSCRTMPFDEVRHIDEEESIDLNSEDDKDEIESQESRLVDQVAGLEDEESPPREIRPKLHKLVAYKVSDEYWKKGKVMAVGKPDGRHKHRCWIKRKDGTVDVVDFGDGLVRWKYCCVNFKETEKDDERITAKSDSVHTGIWFLKNKAIMKDNPEELEVQSVYATKIPIKYHSEPEVLAAKHDELEKWKKYEAYEEVPRGDQYVLSSR